jgi:hypothetical protein
MTFLFAWLDQGRQALRATKIIGLPNYKNTMSEGWHGWVRTDFTNGSPKASPMMGPAIPSAAWQPRLAPRAHGFAPPPRDGFALVEDGVMGRRPIPPQA